MMDDFWGTGRGSRYERPAGFDIAQICINGHVVNSTYRADPEYNKNFCDTCGAKTIIQCQSCNAAIKGEHYTPGVLSMGGYYKPAFCDSCGSAYPWVQGAKDASFQLIDFADTLTDIEKNDFKNCIADLMTQSPKTIVAQVKFVKYSTKAGADIASGLKSTLEDVVAETVKKSIWKE